MSNNHLVGIDANTYANIFTFLGFPLSRELNDSVDAAILGVPYDLATTGRSGCRYGPNGIRQASAQLRWEEKRWPWTFNLREHLNVIDYGDLCYDDGDSLDMVKQLEEEALHILAAGKKLLTFGGDHFITLPLLRAASQIHGKLALIHFDAHTDTEQSDLAYNHGSMFYHAPNEELIDPKHTIQIGIRTEYDPSNHAFQVIDGSQANNLSADEIAKAIRERVGDLPVYLSFDIDCLDPAFAPGTGTPVSGGITSDKALQIIRQLTGMNIVAMDMMEVAPCYDHAETTSLAAATLSLEMLHLLAETAVK